MPMTRSSMARMEQSIAERGAASLRARFAAYSNAAPIYPRLPVRGGLKLEDPTPLTPKRSYKKTKGEDALPVIPLFDGEYNKNDKSNVTVADDVSTKNDKMVLQRSGLDLQIHPAFSTSPRSTFNVRPRTVASHIRAALRDWTWSLVFVVVILTIGIAAWWAHLSYTEYYHMRFVALTIEREKMQNTIEQICLPPHLQPLLLPAVIEDCKAKIAFSSDCCENRAQKETIAAFFGAVEDKILGWLKIASLVIVFILVVFVVGAHYSVTSVCRKREERKLLNAIFEASQRSPKHDS